MSLFEYFQPNLQNHSLSPLSWLCEHKWLKQTLVACKHWLSLVTVGPLAKCQVSLAVTGVTGGQVLSVHTQTWLLTHIYSTRNLTLTLSLTPPNLRDKWRYHHDVTYLLGLGLGIHVGLGLGLGFGLALWPGAWVIMTSWRCHAQLWVRVRVRVRVTVRMRVSGLARATAGARVRVRARAGVRVRAGVICI